MKMYWYIKCKIPDSTAFFRALPELFPQATRVFIEGSSIAEGVALIYRRFSEPGKYLPDDHTIWPKSSKYRCGLSRELCEALAISSENHAEPEILDHLSLYADDECVLDGPDFFSGNLYISNVVSEVQVKKITEFLGGTYEPQNVG